MNSFFIRFLMAVCIAISAVLLCYKLYITKGMIEVSFQVEAATDTRLEVKYTDTPGKSFSKDIGVIHKVKQGASLVRLKLPVKTLCRIRFDILETSCDLVISNISIRGKKELVLSNSAAFEFSRFDKFSCVDGTVCISSNKWHPYFEYYLSEEVGSGFKIMWTTFSIVCILSFLISFAVSTVFVERFSTVPGSLRSSFIFACVFCALLAIPVSNMDDRAISAVEKRKLAEFPKLLSPEGGLNFSFGKEFDLWMQDRFTARASFIKRYDAALSLINGYVQNNVAIAYPDGWMFYKRWASTIFSKPSDEDLKKINRNLLRVEKFCKDNRIRFYLLVCPIKEDVYSSKNILSKRAEKDLITYLVEYLKEQSPALSVVYPRDELIKEKDGKSLLFYKTDTHQSHDGAFVINEALLNKMKAELPFVVAPQKKSFTLSRSNLVGVGTRAALFSGYIHQVLGLDEKQFLDHQYSYYIHQKGSPRTEENELLERTSEWPDGKGSAVLLGDSFTENQAVWMQYTFRKLLKLRGNNGYENNEMRFDRWNKRIAELKPDALVICVSASDCFFHLKNLYKD